MFQIKLFKLFILLFLRALVSFCCRHYLLVGRRDPIVALGARAWESNFTCRANTALSSPEAGGFNAEMCSLRWDYTLKCPFCEMMTTKEILVPFNSMVEILWDYYSEKAKAKFGVTAQPKN